MMRDSSSTAVGFSIFAMMPARSPISARAYLERMGEIGAILVRQRRNRQRPAWQIDSLAARKPPRRVGARGESFRRATQHSELKLAVIELEDVAWFERVDDFGVGNRNRVGLLGLAGEDETIFCAVTQVDPVSRQFSGADFRALEIGEHRDRRAGFGLRLTDGAHHGAGFVVIAVTKIQAEDVDARKMQHAQHRRRTARRPDRRNDLAEPISHASPPAAPAGSLAAPGRADPVQSFLALRRRLWNIPAADLCHRGHDAEADQHKHPNANPGQREAEKIRPNRHADRKHEETEQISVE